MVYAVYHTWPTDPVTDENWSDWEPFGSPP